MSIIIEPTKIKQSVYLLVPRSIVDLVEIKDQTKFKLRIREDGKKQILQYEMDGSK